MPKAGKWTCFHCNYTTDRKSNIRRHVGKHDPGKPPSKVCARTRAYECVLCRKFSSACRDDVFSHYCSAHNVKISPAIRLDFGDWKAFLEWKASVEKREVSEYACLNSRTRKLGSTHYYRCHRDGHYKSRGRGIRRLKIQGSDKINGCCPASMVARRSTDGTVSVKFIPTHVGHDCEVGRLRLPKTDRESLAQKIAQNLPLDTILDDIKTSVVITGELQRIDLTKRQDLKNIVRDYKLRGDVQRQYEISEIVQSNEFSHSEDLLSYDEHLTVVKSDPEDTLLEKKKTLVLSTVCKALSLCNMTQHFDILTEALQPVISTLEAGGSRFVEKVNVLPLFDHREASQGPCGCYFCYHN